MARIRDQRGMTLPEVMFSLFIFTFVLVAVMALLDTSAQTAPKDQERAQSIREAQVGLHRMVRELRQATKILSSSSQWVEVEVRLENHDPATSAAQPYVDRHVLYSCGDQNPGRCVRYETPKGQPFSATGTTLVDRVLNWNVPVDSPRRVFSYPDNDPISPVSVNVRIEVPAKGERKGGHQHSVVLEDGISARNPGGS